MYRRNALVAVLDKPSDFAGRAVHEWTGAGVPGRHQRPAGRPVPADDPDRTNQGSGAEEVRRYRGPALPDEEIDAIDSQYRLKAREEPSHDGGRMSPKATTIGPMVKGPLTVTDMVCWHVGMGMGLYGVQPLRLGLAEPPAHPALLPPRRAQRPGRDAAGALGPGVRPSVREPDHLRLRAHARDLAHSSLHRLDGRRCAGSGRSIASSAVSTTSGTPSGWAGRVVRKYLADGGRPAVDLDLGATNQRGEVTTPGHATVLLPSREHGPVRLPDPPGRGSGLQDALDAIIADFEWRLPRETS